jgi:hypothetical protein
MFKSAAWFPEELLPTFLSGRLFDAELFGVPFADA